MQAGIEKNGPSREEPNVQLLTMPHKPQMFHQLEGLKTTNTKLRKSTQPVNEKYQKGDSKNVRRGDNWSLKFKNT